MLSMRVPTRRDRGFSLVEMMVALVAGLIVVGSVLAFTVATVRSSSENIQATRLMQENRTVMDMFIRELRRAGYDQLAMNGIGRGGAYVSPFASVLVVGGASSCVVFAYDQATHGAHIHAAGAVEDDERRAFRRAVVGGAGVIEVNFGGGGVPACDAAGPNYATTPPTCNAATGWCALSDPRVVNYTGFTLTDTGTAVGTAPNLVAVREIDVQLAGQLIQAPDVQRVLDTTVRVRSDCLRATAAACQVSP